jgi:hypothetical protein
MSIVVFWRHLAAFFDVRIFVWNLRPIVIDGHRRLLDAVVRDS